MKSDTPRAISEIAPMMSAEHLQGWTNFIIMAGTAAATLMGLLFVAATVSTGFSTSDAVHGSRGFLTPTLIHLGAVLFQLSLIHI